MPRDNQRLPTTSNEEYCQDSLVPVFLEAVSDSKERGVAEYGTALQPFNRRNSVRDAFEEWVDLGMYLEQIKRERRGMIDLLYTCVEHATKTQNLTLKRAIQEMLVDLGEPSDV